MKPNYILDLTYSKRGTILTCQKPYNGTMARSKLSQNFFVALASGIFIGAAVFEIFPEVIKERGFSSAIIFLTIGFLAWYLLKVLTDRITRSGLAAVSALAFLFHSFLEGAATALSFSFNFTIGLLVASGMFLHLVPEFFAIVAIMRGEGVSLKSDS